MEIGFVKDFEVGGVSKQTGFEVKILSKLKLHTIRTDINARYMVGRTMRFATGVRTPDYNHFYSAVCSGVQDIRIENRVIIIDDRKLLYDEMLKLILNNGFDTPNDFWGWFDQHMPFKGKLIHWTDLKY